MKKLLNTIYVTTPDSYLSLDGDNLVVLNNDTKIGRVPMHNIESIVTFGYTGASPALMRYCVEHNVSLTFMRQSGKFMARVIGPSRGNVTLRKKQYQISENERESVKIARNFIIGKVYNHKWILERATRDHPLSVDIKSFKNASQQLAVLLKEIKVCDNFESLRGLEGQAAVSYNRVFDEMILQQKEHFYFHGRNRRPPLDNVNAMLSFAYTLLSIDIAGALEQVGLDAYVGFLHRDRPGRASLALDLMEEFRGIMADRFVISLINLKVINEKDFIQKENGSVIMTDEGRKKFISAWQSKKQDPITHPFLDEKISWGLAPYSQSLLLARSLRGDLDQYPPFLWK